MCRFRRLSFAAVILNLLPANMLLAEDEKKFSQTFPLEIFTDFLGLGNWDVTRPWGTPRLTEVGLISEKESSGSTRRLVADTKHNALYLLTGDGFLFRYNIDSLNRDLSLRIPATGLNDIALSRDGNIGLVVGDKGTIGIFAADSSQTIRCFQRDSKITFSRVAFHPQEQLFAASDLDGFVEVARVDTGEVLWRFRAHQWPVSGLSFSSNGDFLYTADTSEILLWNVTTGKVVRRLVPGDTAARHWFNSFAFSSDRNFVAASTVGKIFVFDLRAEAVVRTFDTKNQLAFWHDFTSDNSKLITFQRNRLMSLYNIESGSLEQSRAFKTKPLEFGITGAAIAERGLVFYAGDFSRWIQTDDGVNTWPGAWTSQIRIFKFD